MFPIVNLKSLTVTNLLKLADELGIKLKGKLKADKIKEIENAGINEKKLHYVMHNWDFFFETKFNLK